MAQPHGKIHTPLNKGLRTGYARFDARHDAVKSVEGVADRPGDARH